MPSGHHLSVCNRTDQLVMHSMNTCTRQHRKLTLQCDRCETLRGAAALYGGTKSCKGFGRVG